MENLNGNKLILLGYPKMASVLKLENFIDGKLVACDRHLDSYNPATGAVVLKIPDSGEVEVQRAVDAAKKAFQT